MKYSLILASASPRRRKILSELGLQFDIVVPAVNEMRFEEDPAKTVTENAILKNKWAARRYPQYTILTADTIVVFKNQIIEKPKSMQEAHTFLRMFSGNTQKVLTAISIFKPENQTTESRITESIVHFKTLPEDMIQDYFSKVNPMDKAGGYDVDQYGDLVIDSFEGSFTNIMGLPVETVKEMLSL